MIFNALSIAGSDSGGGAGIQADLKTFAAVGVYGATVVTAVTAQNTREVRAIHDVPASIIAEQLDAVFDDICIHAVKIGMLSRPEVIETVVAALDRHRVLNVVVDPVMVAKSGDKLLDDDAVTVLREHLIPRATVITPNLPEAAELLGEVLISQEEAMCGVGERLLALGAQGVVLKGGHLMSSQSPDLLLYGKHSQWFTSPRIDTRNTHGTGCTLSSAIAGYLARGCPLPQAVEHAKTYVQNTISTADDLDVGQGHGPVNHFGELWRTAAQKEVPDVEAQ